MKISCEVITAKSRELIDEWRFEQGPPCVVYGREIWNEQFFIKNFVPWSKPPATGQTIYDWAFTRLMANEIAKEIDKDILKAINEKKSF